MYWCLYYGLTTIMETLDSMHINKNKEEWKSIGVLSKIRGHQFSGQPPPCFDLSFFAEQLHANKLTGLCGKRPVSKNGKCSLRVIMAREGGVAKGCKLLYADVLLVLR